jgi:hypothetical protein
MVDLQLLKSICINLLSTALWCGGAWGIFKIIIFYRSRNERWFWERFKNRNLLIIIREYQIAISSQEEEIANSVGDGYQISKGMALAMGRLISYSQERVSKPDKIRVAGDQSVSFDKENETLLCLGSKINKVTAQLFEEIGKQYSFPFDTEWDPKKKIISINYLNSPPMAFTPCVSEGGNGKDYALIICSNLLNGPVLIVAGAHMWGTQGGVFAITNRSWLKKIRRKFNKVSNFAFILEITVCKGEPQTNDIVLAIRLGEKIN